MPLRGKEEGLSKNEYMQVYAYFDGSCYPTNPSGYMGMGYIIYNELEEIKGSKIIDKHPSNTNNIAEYEALYLLLNALLENNLQTKSILIRGDSKLVINQMNKTWKVKKPHIKDLFIKCRKLLLPFNHVEFEWIPREQNTKADELSTSF